MRSGLQNQTRSRLTRLLLATVLIVAALLVPSPSAAQNHQQLCRQCSLYGDCLACCVCHGNSFYDCLEFYCPY